MVPFVVVQNPHFEAWSLCLPVWVIGLFSSEPESDSILSAHLLVSFPISTLFRNSQGEFLCPPKVDILSSSHAAQRYYESQIPTCIIKDDKYSIL
ncbi:hypothetical protein CEXT_4621 [Caerostris extrusa]|uniref:Uncharacterized protein n=1 Tax=Caerostris extrusa TaxID=172846 RepID=A0AAV4TXZ0_CAEEX|nr:hypothetical protein CEXT_4621 [Caerostris extrusa]